jgi:hypothetical protein
MLECIAEHRILTVTQVAVIFDKGRQVIRRRLNNLEQAGLIEVTGRELGRGRGRPENSMGLTNRGVDVLRGKGLLNKSVPYEKICADYLVCNNHQLLLNWFRIHLNQVEKTLPGVNLKLFSHNSPFLPKGPNDQMLITDYSPVPGSGINGVKFTPDAVFSITDTARNKTCLYFIEVDRGTETIASPKRDMTDIRQKIVNYQWYFQSLAYKRYEQVFKCQLHGFQLLFLTSSSGRLRALCELTQQLRPSNFIYLTDISRIFPEGVSSEIWIKGDDINGPQHSILGSLYCKAPLF